VRTYILKRLLLMVPTLIGMTLLTYAIVRLAPGDPIEAMIRNQSGNIDPKAMRESADRIRDRLGLNDVNFWGPDVESHLPDLKSPDPAVRARAAAELKRVTGLDLNETREAWEDWWNKEKKVASDTEPLIEDLTGAEAARRESALAKLQKLTAKQLAPDAWKAWLKEEKKDLAAAEPLVWDLRSPDDAERVKAAAELRRLTGLDFTESPDAWEAWWSVNKYSFTQKHLIDPAEKAVNVFYGYGRWVCHLADGDFGESIIFRMPRSSPIVGYLTDFQNWAWGVDVPAVETALVKLGSPQEKDHAEAAKDLKRLTRQSFGEDAAAWQKWWTDFCQAHRPAGWWKDLAELRANGSKNPFWIILDRIPVTFNLNIIAEFLIFIVAIPVGLAAARYQGKWFDRGSSFVLIVLWSIPIVLAGSLLLAFLAKGGLGAWWFPVAGLHAPDYEKMTWGGWLGDLLWHATLPVFCLVYTGFAYLAKLGRASLLENLRADYVRTARAKGLSERRVVYYHAFRNSLLPMITVSVLTLPGLLGGSVVVETIFSIQGTGILLVSAAQAYDLSVIMSEVLLYGVLTLLFLLVGDMLYAWADPRVRYE